MNLNCIKIMKSLILILSMIILGMFTAGNSVKDVQNLPLENPSKFSGYSGYQVSETVYKSYSPTEILKEKIRIQRNNYSNIYPIIIEPDWITHSELFTRYGDGISAGDLNNDGYDDVVIGAPGYDTSGAVFIYLGSTNGPSINPDKTLYGTDIGFGDRVDCKGDINNDGYKDLIVGDPFNGAGIVWVYYGSLTGITDTANSRLDGPVSGFNFGYSVSSADVNGDGYSDLIASVQNVYNDTLDVGAYVYFGSSAGINLFYTWTASVPAILNCTGLYYCVSDAGDINNDGFDDVILGSLSNLAFVFYGASDKGMYEPADVILSQPYIGFGRSVSTAGDINADGFDDIAIAAEKCFIYFGQQSGLSLNFTVINTFGNTVTSAGDINNDGFNDIVSAEFAFFHNTMLFFGSQAGVDTMPVTLNRQAINLSNGDINGDGISDVVGGIDNSNESGFGFFGATDNLQYLTFTSRDTALIQTDQLCINSQVRSQYGLPMSGISVNYIVKGANTASGNSLSDSSGISRFCYTAQSTGRDTIIASFENIFDTAFAVWDYPLPIELASFTSFVSGRDVTLNWSTSNELNNSGFDIERAVDNGQKIIDNGQLIIDSWVKVGFVEGNGTTNEPKQYTFTDKNLPTGNYKYRLRQIDFNGNFEYFELDGAVSIGIPEKFSLSQNYPNPFNPVTNLEFGISELGFVSLKIYDAVGREVVTLVNENLMPGFYSVKFDASYLSSGVYFYRLSAAGRSGEFSVTKRMLLVK